MWPTANLLPSRYKDYLQVTVYEHQATVAKRVGVGGGGNAATGECDARGSRWTEDLWTFRPQDISPLPGRFAPSPFRPKTFRPCLDVSPPGRFALWTIRPLDDSTHARGRFAPELSFLSVSPCRCGRTDGCFAELRPKHVQSSRNGIGYT